MLVTDKLQIAWKINFAEFNSLGVNTISRFNLLEDSFCFMAKWTDTFQIVSYTFVQNMSRKYNKLACN